MTRMKQFRDPKLSIWQSAVDEVLARKAVTARAEALAGGAVARPPRPNATHPMVRETASYCSAMGGATSFSRLGAAPPPPEGILHTLGYCSISALKLAKAAI